MGQFSFTDEHGIWMRISYYAHPNPNMPSITLLPMIHLGEKEYYRTINNEVWCHDTAFLEGCYMPARRALHLWHRIIGRSSGLSLQSGKKSIFKKWKKEARTSGKIALSESIQTSSCDCGDCYRFKLRKVRTDLHRWHSFKAFKAMPWWVKLSFPLLILIALISAPFLNLREATLDMHSDEACECENCKGDKEFFLTKIFNPIFKFITDDRDLFLRMVLAEALIDPINHRKALCVKYGEKHMTPLAETLLHDFGYILCNQRDILAVKKTKTLDVSAIATGHGSSLERMWARADAWKDREPKPEIIVSTTLSPEYPNEFTSYKTQIQFNFPTLQLSENNIDKNEIKLELA